VVAVLERAGAGGLEASAVARQLPWPAREAALEEALATLERQGVALPRRGRWFIAAASGDGVGTVEVLLTGDAWVRPPRRPGQAPGPGWLVPAAQLGEALEGDRVRVRPAGRRIREVDGRRLPEATLVAVLEAHRERLVGVTAVGQGGGPVLLPYDPKDRVEIDLEGPPVPAGTWVEARAAGTGLAATARVTAVLGADAQPEAATAVVIRHYGLPEEFPAAVRAVAAELPGDPRPGEAGDREDWTAAVVVTIDGESSRDLDDALSVERTAGGFRLGVHIADVSHYVPEGGPLDLEAYRRGTSVYFPERVLSMLPEALSNGLCSLNPGRPRLAFSVILQVDGSGWVTRRRFARTVIRSRRRLTYDEVRRLLEEPHPRDGLEYGPVLDTVRDLAAVEEVLARRRRERGSMDFDLPEGDVTLDTDGEVVGISPRQRTRAHRIVEEAMIAANEAAASELRDAGLPALYRVHDAPPREDLRELAASLAPLGLELPVDGRPLPPGALQALLDRVHGQPEEDFVTSLALRAVKSASYSTEPRGHYALASGCYTHFTSPIRRYPDLVVHRQLGELLAAGAGAARETARRTLRGERLPWVAVQATRTERRALAAERDLLQWKKVRFLAPRVGETFHGRISGVQPFGFFVLLEPELVSGLVAIRTLVDDFYQWEPEAHRLVGANHGRVFQLGDPVAVVLTGIEERHRGLVLALPDLREPTPHRGGPRRHQERR
jgi:ribonuclease R